MKIKEIISFGFGKKLFYRIKKDPLKIAIILSILYPFFLSLRNILDASIPFWYDPARDFLLALDNLKKFTLIGPPSGIPGLFYGPYWIWMISFTLLLSKDPRFTAVIIMLLPYLIIFPYIIFKFSKIFDRQICLILWLFFIISSQSYTTFIWNPHLAPLLYLILVYLLINIKSISMDVNLKNLLKTFIAGTVSGLLLNLHISFGLGIFIASVIFLIFVSVLDFLKNKYHKIRFIFSGITVISSFITGFIATLIPYFIFELRHDFLQSRSLIKTVTNAVLYNSASVGQTGLSKSEIIHKLFIEKTSALLSFKNEQVLTVYILIAGLFIYMFLKKKLSFDKNEKKLIIYLLICITIIFFLFITSKNPVWDYHFIGAEIIFLLAVGLAAKKISFVKIGFSFWLAIIMLINIASFISSNFSSNPYSISSLATKRYIVERIYQDADRRPFSVFAYSPAIYTYDFDYIFRWLGEDLFRYLPEQDPTKSSFVYLIIPKTSDIIQSDFIKYKTPEGKYITADQWLIPDGTTVVKRKQNN